MHPRKSVGYGFDGPTGIRVSANVACIAVCWPLLGRLRVNIVTLKEIRKALGEVSADLSTFQSGTRNHPFLELAAAKRAIKASIATLSKCIAALDEVRADGTNLHPGTNVSAKRAKH